MRLNLDPECPGVSVLQAVELRRRSELDERTRSVGDVLWVWSSLGDVSRVPGFPSGDAVVD